MDQLEMVSIKMHNAWFVDLFVRPSNKIAVGMYKQLGYIVFREIENYYSGEEDAYDMRKALPRDKKEESYKCNKFRIKPHELEY